MAMQQFHLGEEQSGRAEAVLDSSLQGSLTPIQNVELPELRYGTLTPSQLLAEIGFTAKEQKFFTDLLSEWPVGAKREAFRVRLEPHIEEQKARAEVGDRDIDLKHAAHSLGKVIFWASMCKKFDSSMPNGMDRAGILMRDEYCALATHLATFMKEVLFASDSPLTRVLRQEFEGQTLPIQTDFLKGALQPFIDVYDLPSQDPLLRSIQRFFENLSRRPEVSIRDLNLSAHEEKFLREILDAKTEPGAPKTNDSQRIRHLLPAERGEVSEGTVHALIKEFESTVKIDEDTCVAVLRAVARCGNWKMPALSEQVMTEMNRQCRSDWDSSSSDQVHCLALKAVMSVQSTNGPGFSERVKTELQKALKRDLKEKKPAYVGDVQRFAAHLLEAKDKL